MVSFAYKFIKKIHIYYIYYILKKQQFITITTSKTLFHIDTFPRFVFHIFPQQNAS